MQLIGYPPCSTCKKAAKWLSEHGYDLPMRDIKAQPPTLEELTEWTAAGPELKRWFNTSGQVYRALGLKDKLPAMPRGEQLALLAGDGMLVKRPCCWTMAGCWWASKSASGRRRWNNPGTTCLICREFARTDDFGK